MPRIKIVNTSPKFNNITADSRAEFEWNDCGVKAVALLCDVPYTVARAKLKELGRTDRKGTPYQAIYAAIDFFGYEIRKWTIAEHRAVIDSYPGHHKMLHQITTHHPRRFKAVWAAHADKRLLLCVRKHVAAYVGGEVVDWSVNSSKRIWQIVEVTKK
jgi:hypothetical protein